MESPIVWVKLAKYVELTGDSADAVHARRKAGKWLNGNECKIVDGNLWINLPAVERWVENWGKPFMRTPLPPMSLPELDRQGKGRGKPNG